MGGKYVVLILPLFGVKSEGVESSIFTKIIYIIKGGHPLQQLPTQWAWKVETMLFHRYINQIHIDSTGQLGQL